MSECDRLQFNDIFDRQFSACSCEECWSLDYEIEDDELIVEHEIKIWAVLYDRDDREIARYSVIGSATVGNLLITWALNHHNIEYVKIITT